MLALVAGLALSPTPQKFNWNEPHVYTLMGQGHGHAFSVRFEHANFTPRGRKIVWILTPGSVGSGDPPTKGMFLPGYMAGKKKVEFWGWDTIPYEEIHGKTAEQMLRERDTELISLKVTVDGRPWAVRPSLYLGLLDPDLGKNYVTGAISKDGNALKVHMDGSDGAGGYGVDWVFHRNGKHTRNIRGED